MHVFSVVEVVVVEVLVAVVEEVVDNTCHLEQEDQHIAVVLVATCWVDVVLVVVDERQPIQHPVEHVDVLHCVDAECTPEQ